jgi:predicted Zn-dependent peptidase
MLQETPTQTIGGRLRVSFGALNEKPGEEGLAHFLEHNLMTGGSSKYEPEESDQVRNIFGSYNAFTGLEETTFPVDMLAEDLGLYLNFVSDIAFNPLLNPERFEEERNRILRETADAKGKPDFIDNNAYHEAFFGENDPRTYFILGEEDVIGSVTPDKLREFHSRGYGASNMDLILVGALPDNIEDLIKDNFEGRESGENTRFKFPRNSPLEGIVTIHSPAPEIFNEDRPYESSAQLDISLFASTRSDPDSYAVQMLSDILGGDANSRLFQRVSQRMGLAYGFRSAYHGAKNEGAIYSGGSIKAERSNEVIDAVFDEMRILREDLVPNEVLDRNKRIARYNVLKNFESNKGHANAIGIKYDRGITTEDHLEKYGAVTPQDVHEVANKYLPSNREHGKYVMMLRDPLKN